MRLTSIVPVLIFSCFFISHVAYAQEDPSAIVLRLNRLENQVRDLSGKVEELQHENRLLKEHIKDNKNDLKGSQTSKEPVPVQQGKVFDPEKNPDAPGAPKSLGEARPSEPLSEEELSSNTHEVTENSKEQEAIPETQKTPYSQSENYTLSKGILSGEEEPPFSEDPVTDNGQELFDEAQDSLQSGYYEQAELRFKAFIHEYPKHKLIPMAIYNLGQSYAKRGRHREAAEQYISIATNYPDSEPAPDSMVKLGISLQALGAPDKACALFSEVKKRYPKASEFILIAAQEEHKRAKCR